MTLNDIFSAIANFFRRNPDMDVKTLNAKIAKLTTDAAAATATINQQTQSLKTKDTQIADLQAQLQVAQSGQGDILQQIANGLDAIDAALPDAPTAPK